MSCLPVSLFSMIIQKKIPLEIWAAEAKEMGLDGFDISMMFLDNHTPVYLRTLQEKLEKVGLPIVMACTYPDFVHPAPLQRDRELAYLKRDIAVCSELGVKYLRVLAGQNHPGLTREEGIHRAVEGLSAASVAADKYGVQLVYEDHAKPGAWDYIDFSFPPEIFLEIVDRLRNTSVGVNFDTGNISSAGWQTIPVLEAIVDRIKTIHVSDTSTFGKFDPIMIGTGVTPNREIFRFLKKHGFDGWLCIEEASNTGLDGIRKAVAVTRDLWEKA
ncbi:MAG: sugar phosphate isomerase/epimerase [Clostridia bacterium]|nr:sugar phosphate isomerase/epimerase [Clostridia bacterium]